MQSLVIGAVATVMLAQATPQPAPIPRAADLPPRCASTAALLEAPWIARSEAVAAKDHDRITGTLAVWDARVNQTRFVCKTFGRELTEAELDDSESDLFAVLDGQRLLAKRQASEADMRATVRRCQSGAAALEGLRPALDEHLTKLEVAEAVGLALGQKAAAEKLNLYCGGLLVERLKVVTSYADTAEARARALPPCHQAATQWAQLSGPAKQAAQVGVSKYREFMAIPQVAAVEKAMNEHCAAWPDHRSQAHKAWQPVRDLLRQPAPAN